MAAIGVIVFGLAQAGCGSGNGSSGGLSDDSDLVRSAGQEGSSGGNAGRVVFLGTSLTSGLGLNDPTHRFTDRIQALADLAELPFRMVNAGVSGDTSAGGVGRISWLLRAPVQVLVLELGANDGIRGLPPDSMHANLQAVIDSTRAHYPGARLLLAGMQAPPNLGPAYSSAFSSAFSDLARANGGTLIPFLLEGVAGVPDLNQADGIHPTSEGHRMVAETIWAHLRPILEDLITEQRTDL